MSTSRTKPIGPGEVLLHIGPHKTGTTAIQAALAAARAELAARHGVVYPGDRRSQADAARVASGFVSTTGAPMPPADAWDAVVAEVRGHRGRSVVSSEFFDVVQPDRGRRIVDELGGVDRVEVVVTAAPLTSVLPSSWQQAVRSSLTTGFEDWLREIFDDHASGASSTFWTRQRIDRQIERWADVVGLDRVRLVISDKTRPRQLFDAFEDLLDLPRETLTPQPAAANRSFTWPEIELVRAVNQRVAARGWSAAVHARFVRIGAVHQMRKRRPRPDEPTVVLPAWAVDQAIEIAHTMVERIEASGVEVVGDPAALVAPPSVRVEALEPVRQVGLEIAVRAIIGAMRGGGADVLREKAVTRATVQEYPGVSSAPTELLRAELERREGRRGLRRLGRRR